MKKEMSLQGPLIFTFIMLLLSLVLFVYVLNYPFRAQVFPLILGIVPLFVFSFLQIVKELRSNQKTDSDINEEKEAGRMEWKKTIIVFCWIIGFILLVGLVGFIVAIPTFSFLFLTFYWRENWRIAVLSALLTIAAIYVLFVMVFDIPLYMGPF